MFTKLARPSPVVVVDEESNIKVTPKIISVVSASTITGVTEATLYGAKPFTKVSF